MYYTVVMSNFWMHAEIISQIKLSFHYWTKGEKNV